MNNDNNEIIMLVKRAGSGDNDAFEKLVLKYENFIYNLICQMTGNDQDAYDISQEVFIKVYRAIKNFRFDCKFSTWLYKITANAVKDYFREKQKHRTVSLSDWTEEDESESGFAANKPPEIIEEDINSRPEEAYERGEIREAVRDAILHLSEDHKVIITLRDMEGYSYDDISDMLGIEIGTVKSRLNRARLAVKDYLLKRNFIEY
ncbi:MAG: sigma-70 family RNA polymerase sigma factor [Oscillospiraceae bacterium]|nr:sigma-70 family RNA polymerase sigma factor [Oscillospiraceae bacterium]